MVSRAATFVSDRVRYAGRLALGVPGVRASRDFVLGRPVHWTRVVMDRETDAYVRALDYPSMSALEISGKKWADFGFGSYRRAGWPDYDWCSQTLDGTYDIIIAEQVLEHVERPAAALRNAHAMLAPDGVLLITTPFLIRIHEYPLDCFRWTPHGLRVLLNECGFPTVETGAWGNRRCVRANFEKWVDYVPWRHSLRNEPNFPVSVWAFARKGEPPAQ